MKKRIDFINMPARNVIIRSNVIKDVFEEVHLKRPALPSVFFFFKLSVVENVKYTKGYLEENKFKNLMPYSKLKSRYTNGVSIRNKSIKKNLSRKI